MASFKEIVTKAVIGKAKKTSTSKFRVTPTEAPDTVLGCWVINHTFEGHSQNGVIVRSLTQPTVTDVKVEQGVVNLSIEKELGVEIVGNTMIKVSVEDEEDDYEVIEDTKEEEIDQVIDEIDENYLK